jgi:hypothetical protein
MTKAKKAKKKLKTLKEFVSNNLNEGHNSMDPPAVLIMKRKSIRLFPDGQKVALYYVEKIDKYVTVPYTSLQVFSPEETEK